MPCRLRDPVSEIERYVLAASCPARGQVLLRMMSTRTAPCIQARGHLLAVDLDNWQVVLASAGVSGVLGLPEQEVIGKPLLDLVGAELLDAWVQSLGWGGVSRVPQRFLGQRLSPSCYSADVVVQALGSLLLIELLPRSRPLIGIDDTPALEQFAQRLRAASDEAARSRLLAEEIRVLLAHRQCQVWMPLPGTQQLHRHAIVPRSHAPAEPAGGDVQVSLPPTPRYPGRHLQLRVIADLQCSGRPLQGSRDAAARLGRRPILGMPGADETSLLETQGARSAVLIEQWQDTGLARMFIALSPEPVSLTLDPLIAAERLLLIDTLVAGRAGMPD